MKAELIANIIAAHCSGDESSFKTAVEALAADEQDVPTNCWGSGSVDCPVTKVKVEYVATGYSLEK